MVICATPDCGTPGRPFPACDLCKGRAYCGSHCLYNIPADLKAHLLYLTQQPHSPLPDGLVSSHEVDALLKASDICPPCKARFQELLDFLQQHLLQLQLEDSEEVEEEAAEAEQEEDNYGNTNQHQLQQEQEGG